MTSKESISPKQNDIDTHSVISMQELDPSPVHEGFSDLESGQYIPQSQVCPSKVGNISEARQPRFNLGLRGHNWDSWWLEHVILTVPILIHIASGITLRNLRSSRRARLYGAETRVQRYSLNFWPRMSLQARLGYCFVPFLGAHVLVNRITPLIADGGSSGVGLGYVAHGIARNPVFWNVYYVTLAAVGMWHIVGGWGAWMGWRVTTAQKERGYKKCSMESYLGHTESEEQVKRKRKMWWIVNGVAALGATVWLAGALGIIGRGGQGSGWEASGWNEIYKQVPIFGPWL
ncbi:hypothetical protein APSETT444_006574 [Aspergillus pseudonomiae]